MAFIAKTCYYFEKPGPENTEDAARFAIGRAQELGISTVVVASSSGKTAQIFFGAMKGSGLSLVVVTHFSQTGECEFSAATAQELRKQGVRIMTGTLALSGLERALSRSLRVGGGSRTEAIAEALRQIVGSGLKVAIECVLIAADQGAIGIEKEVVAVGGTRSGADTVCVICPAYTASFFDLQVREIVAMPRVR
jgi:hypothetical protein